MANGEYVAIVFWFFFGFQHCKNSLQDNRFWHSVKTDPSAYQELIKTIEDSIFNKGKEWHSLEKCYWKQENSKFGDLKQSYTRQNLKLFCLTFCRDQNPLERILKIGGNRSQLILLNSLDIRSKIWRRSPTINTFVLNLFSNGITNNCLLLS